MFSCTRLVAIYSPNKSSSSSSLQQVNKQIKDDRGLLSVHFDGIYATPEEFYMTEVNKEGVLNGTVTNKSVVFYDSRQSFLDSVMKLYDEIREFSNRKITLFLSNSVDALGITVKPSQLLGKTEEFVNQNLTTKVTLKFDEGETGKFVMMQVSSQATLNRTLKMDPGVTTVFDMASNTDCLSVASNIALYFASVERRLLESELLRVKNGKELELAREELKKSLSANLELQKSILSITEKQQVSLKASEDLQKQVTEKVFHIDKLTSDITRNKEDLEIKDLTINELKLNLKKIQDEIEDFKAELENSKATEARADVTLEREINKNKILSAEIFRLANEKVARMKPVIPEPAPVAPTEGGIDHGNNAAAEKVLPVLSLSVYSMEIPAELPQVQPVSKVDEEKLKETFNAKNEELVSKISDLENKLNDNVAFKKQVDEAMAKLVDFANQAAVKEKQAVAQAAAAASTPSNPSADAKKCRLLEEAIRKLEAERSELILRLAIAEQKLINYNIPMSSR
jgi:hypothetical protein